MQVVLVAARKAARHSNQIHVDCERARDLNVREDLEHVARHERNPVARRDLDGTLETWFTCHRLVVRRVALAVDRLLALKRRLEERVAGAERDATELRSAPSSMPCRRVSPKFLK